LRYKATATLIGLAEDPAKERPPVETENWYRHWIGRLAAARDGIQRRQLEFGPVPGGNPAELEAIERAQEDLAVRLGATKIKNQVAREISQVENPTAAWRDSLPRQSLATFAWSRGASNSLVLELPHVQPPGVIAHLGYASGFVGACVLFYLLVSRGPLGDWLIQWPYAFGVLLGLGWWFFLAPGVIGLVIIAASVIGSLRSDWA
jgi:hypothetical protein